MGIIKKQMKTVCDYQRWYMVHRPKGPSAHIYASDFAFMTEGEKAAVLSMVVVRWGTDPLNRVHLYGY